MNKRIVLTSILTICLCFSLMAGTTFALFTSSSKVNIAITSGKVDVVATIDDQSLETSSFGVSQQQGYFENGGTAVFDSESTLNLNLLTPGDKADFKIKLTNNSNVNIQYRVKWQVEGDLKDALVATADNEKIINNTSSWKEWIVQSDTDKQKEINISVSLPAGVTNEYQNAAAQIYFTVEAVQGNAVMEDIYTEEQLKIAMQTGGTTIKLMNDIELTERIEVLDGQVITLDLNGKTLSSEQQLFWINYGDVTITGNGTIKTSGGSDESNRFATIGGSSATTPTHKPGQYAYLTIENGNFICEDGVSGKAPLLHALANAYITINGGYFSMNKDEVNTSTSMPFILDAYNWGNAVYTINGGYFLNWTPGTDPNSSADWLGHPNYSNYRKMQIPAGYKFDVAYTDGAGDWYSVVTDDTYTFVSTAQELKAALENADSNCKNIALTNDIDMSGVRFTSPTITHKCSSIVIDGGNYTISNMQDMLIAYTASASSIIIKRLTIDKANIAVDVDDLTETTAVGAFIGYAGTTTSIELQDCHLTNSTVVGGHWTGGLIGYAAGYSDQNNGPVFETVNITYCSVDSSTIQGKGSVGGIIGHGTGDVWTKVWMNWTKVIASTITSTGDSTVKAGSVIGTVGVAGNKYASKTGGVWFNNGTTSDNIVTSNNVLNDKIYGRQGNQAGKLYINNTAVVFN